MTTNNLKQNIIRNYREVFTGEKRDMKMANKQQRRYDDPI